MIDDAPWDDEPDVDGQELKWTFSRYGDNKWGASVFLQEEAASYRPKHRDKIVVTKKSGATRDCVVNEIVEVKEYDSGSVKVVVSIF